MSIGDLESKVTLSLTPREAWVLNHVITVALEQLDVFGSETTERRFFAAQLLKVRSQIPERSSDVG